PVPERGGGVRVGPVGPQPIHRPVIWSGRRSGPPTAHRIPPPGPAAAGSVCRRPARPQGSRKAANRATGGADAPPPAGAAAGAPAPSRCRVTVEPLPIRVFPDARPPGACVRSVYRAATRISALEVVGVESDSPQHERREVDVRRSESRGRRGILTGIPAALVG